MADPIRIVVEYSAAGELVIRQAINNLDGLRERVERLSAAGPLSSRAMRMLAEDAERVATAYHGRLATGFGVARNEANHLFDTIDRFGHRAFYGLIGVTAAASAGLYGLGKAFLAVNEDFAGLEITVKSSLQSAQAARRIRDEVAAITASSPLPFKDLGESTRNLITMPFSRNEIAKQVSQGSLSDQQGFFRQSVELVEQMIAFRPDKEAKDAIYSIREALSGQFRSLIRRFDIPSTALSTTAGKSIKELSNDPKATFDAMKTFFGRIITPEAIQELIRQPRFLFQNAMEQIFHIPLLKVGDHSYNAIVDQLTSLYNRITAFTKSKFDGYAVKMAASVKSIFTTVSDTGGKVAEYVLDKAGYGQSKFMGETMFERGARLVDGALKSLAENLPKMLQKATAFFERVLPFLQAFGNIVLTLGKAFLSFADFSPMLAALTLFFRRSILDVISFGAETIAQRLAAGATAAVTATRAASGAPNFSGLSPLAPQSVGWGRDGVLSAQSRSRAATALTASVYAPPTVLDAARVTSDANYRSGALTLNGVSASMLRGVPTVLAGSLGPQADALRRVVQNPAGVWRIAGGTSAAQVREIETVLGRPPSSLRSGMFLPNQPAVASTMAGYAAAIGQATATLSARRAAELEASRQMVEANSRIGDARVRAANQPGFFSRAGLAARGAELGAMVTGARTSLAAAAPGLGAALIPAASIAAILWSVSTLSDTFNELTEKARAASTALGKIADNRLGGEGARNQILLNSVESSSRLSESIALENEARSRERSNPFFVGPTLPPLVAEAVSVRFQELRSKSEEVDAKAGTASVPMTRTSYWTASRQLRMGELELRVAAERAAQDDQRISDWQKGGNVGSLSLLTNPDVTFNESTPKEVVDGARNTMEKNRKVFLEAIQKQEASLSGQVRVAYLQVRSAPLAPQFQEFHEKLRSQSAKMFGDGFLDYFKEIGTKGRFGYRQGSLASAKELMSGFQSSAGDSYQESFDSLEKQVRDEIFPFKAGTSSLEKLSKVSTENKEFLARVQDAIFNRKEEFIEGMVRFEREFRDRVREWNAQNPEYKKSDEGVALFARMQSEARRVRQDPRGTMNAAAIAKFNADQSSVREHAYQSFAVEMGSVATRRLSYLPEESDRFLGGIENMAEYLNSLLEGPLNIPSLLEKAKLTIPDPKIFGERAEKENLRALSATSDFYEFVQAQISKNGEGLRERMESSRLKWEALATAESVDPSKLLKSTDEERKLWSKPLSESATAARSALGEFRQFESATNLFSGLATEFRFKAQKALGKSADEERYNREVQARDQLPGFFRRLPELSSGLEGSHAIAELQNALKSLEWTDLLESLGSLDVFLKDASGADHIAVMADKWRKMDEILPKVSARLQEQLDDQRRQGLNLEAKKTESAQRELLRAGEESRKNVLDYFTQGILRASSEVSSGIDDYQVRADFDKMLGNLAVRFPQIDQAGARSAFAASLADQTLPSEAGQVEAERARFAQVALFRRLLDGVVKSLEGVQSEYESFAGWEGDTTNTQKLKSELDSLTQAKNALSSRLTASVNDLQREFVTRQRLYADQALKTAQGALQSGLEASLSARPSQIARFQLADLEKSVREAGLEGQIDTRRFLADSTGPENIAVLLEKQKGLEEVFERLADQFENLAQAAEKVEIQVPEGWTRMDNGQVFNEATGETMSLRPDQGEIDRNRSLSRSLSGRANSLRTEREDVQGTGMFDSFSRGFSGVTERFRAEAQNFKDIGADIGQSLQSNLGNAFADFVTGTKSASQAFADFGKSILSEVARIFANKAAAQLIGFAFSAFTASVAAPAATGASDLRSVASPGTMFAAEGGPIRGGSGIRDDVPAMLMGGEFVIRRAAVERYGERFMEALNEGRLVERATGGMVPHPSGSSWTAPEPARAEPSHIGAPVNSSQSSYGDSHVTIVINEGGQTQESSKGAKNGPQGDNQEFARMLKSAVLEVMNTQRRPGGAWRNS